MTSKQIGGIAVAVVVFIALATVFFGSWFTVDQGMLGVRLRAGAVVGVVEPGLGFKMPLMDNVVELSMRTEKQTYEKMQAYSKDIQVADLRLSVNYRLDPAKVKDIYSELGTRFVDSILTPATNSQTKIVFGQYTANSVVAERARLVADISEAIRESVAERGIIVENVNLENVDFSDEYEKSIEARMMAEVEVTRIQQNLQREKVTADIVRTQASAAADKVRFEAQATADTIRLRGEAEANITKLRGAAEAEAITARAKALAQNDNLVELVKAERWNGALPATMIPGAGVPMIGLK